jgi:hypothetical protein
MFLYETKETKEYSRKSKYGKLMSYIRSKTLTHWECDKCGTEFTKVRNGKYDTTAKSFCSKCISKIGLHKLANEASYDKKVKSTLSKRSGQVIIAKDGYPEVYIGKDYPYRNGGYTCIREHVFVMETFLERRLTKGEIVHHIDGNKRNNHLSNLFLTTVAEHNKLHAESESIIFELVKMGVVEFNRDTGRYQLQKEKIVQSQI